MHHHVITVWTAQRTKSPCRCIRFICNRSYADMRLYQLLDGFSMAAITVWCRFSFLYNYLGLSEEKTGNG